MFVTKSISDQVFAFSRSFSILCSYFRIKNVYIVEDTTSFWKQGKIDLLFQTDQIVNIMYWELEFDIFVASKYHPVMRLQLEHSYQHLFVNGHFQCGSTAHTCLIFIINVFVFKVDYPTSLVSGRFFAQFHRSLSIN